MGELKVVAWKRYGQDRLYVNLSDGTAVAWADRRTGKVTILQEPYRREALRLLRARLTRSAKPATAASPNPPLHRQEAPPVPKLPPLTPAHDLALNRPGESLREKLEAEGPTLSQRLINWLLRRPSELDSYRKGLTGELRVGAELQRLSHHGWRVLHSIELPRKVDIDHLLIGPGGVFCINTKRHLGKAVWVGDEMARVNHGKPQPYGRKSKAEADRVQTVLERHVGFPVRVEPVLVFVGVTRLEKAPTQLAVRVYREREVSALGPLSGVLSPEQIDTVYAVARHRCVWLTT
ncbi:nuclease-related domain-containing protein [Streptomyces sp. NPDC053474]|uniref:nuclease-related domain-containing protein n=1 Tax=Streptomyces sp. NPDC053474 TaxID=3365704 RepID=UPI0037CF950A